MAYRHALVCIDFRSTEARRLLERAVDLLSADGRLSAVSVIEVGTFDEDRDAVATLVEEEFQARSAHLARWCADAGHPDAEQQVLVGKPAAQIAAYAGDNGCDLVVMGPHEGGRRPPGLGSTAEAAMRHLGCDVLVVISAADRPR